MMHRLTQPVHHVGSPPQHSTRRHDLASSSTGYGAKVVRRERTGAHCLGLHGACGQVLLGPFVHGTCDRTDRVQQRYLGMHPIRRLVRCALAHRSTKSSNTFKTETQNKPVSSPASHDVPNITNSAQSASYVNSLAAGGASRAYASQPYSGSRTNVPPPTTVELSTVKTSAGHKITTTIVNPSNAGSSVVPSQAIPVLLGVAVALAGGGALVL